jgi:hypothetical protein
MTGHLLYDCDVFKGGISLPNPIQTGSKYHPASYAALQGNFAYLYTAQVINVSQTKNVNTVQLRNNSEENSSRLGNSLNVCDCGRYFH